MREVEYAVVEHDGSVSAVPFDWAQPAVKADVDPEMAKARDRALEGRDEAPDSKRTDSPRALDRTPEELR
jgi:uncharacterized membrane protein YcaP (DUF421 family)